MEKYKILRCTQCKCKILFDHRLVFFLRHITSNLYIDHLHSSQLVVISMTNLMYRSEDERSGDPDNTGENSGENTFVFNLD